MKRLLEIRDSAMAVRTFEAKAGDVRERLSANLQKAKLI